MKRFLLSAAMLLALPVFGVDSSQDLARSQRVQKTIDWLEYRYVNAITQLSMDSSMFMQSAHNYNAAARTVGDTPVTPETLRDLSDFENHWNNGMLQPIFSNITNADNEERTKAFDQLSKNEQKNKNIRKFTINFLRQRSNNISENEVGALEQVFQNLKISDGVNALKNIATSRRTTSEQKRSDATTRNRDRSEDRVEAEGLEHIADKYLVEANKKEDLASDFLREFFMEFPTLDDLCQEK